MSYTKIENKFLDEIMATLKPIETICYLIISRKTNGWQKEIDQISISQFMKFTGLSKNSVKTALKGLIEKDRIIKHNSGNGNTISSYSINTKESNFDAQGGQTVTDRGSSHDPTIEIYTKENIYTPPEGELTPLQEKNETNAQPKKYGPQDKIPNSIKHDFVEPKHVEFLNQNDEQIIASLNQYLYQGEPDKNKDQRENLQADIDTFLGFARKNKVRSMALIYKLINVNYILDKFSLEQFIRAYNIALERAKKEPDVNKKLSYIRKILERGVMPKVYKMYSS